MEFRVLGPVEVLESGRRLDLGGPKQLTILALLVANGGRRLSTDRLIEAAYDDDSRAGARRSVQTFVSNLRAQLGDMISSVASGYEFRPIDSFVDAEQFATNVEAARALLDDDPAAARAGLEAALATWRGHPFQDVESRGELDAEIVRLSELRLVALESRIEADLATGRDRELVAELEALTAEHPFREAFQSQHMLSLYRAGRQAESLRAYGRMREHLVDELGVDPTPALRQLEQRILEQDPTLLLDTETQVRRGAVVVVDVVASTVESVISPDERRRVLIDVDQAIERSIVDADGAVVAQQGTATYGVFGDIRGALDAAVEISRTAPRANGHSVVRVGLDVGDVEERPDGGVDGPAVIRAAGLVAAAHPGQALLSSGAQAQLADEMPVGSVLEALGEHSIARLDQVEPVHQLVIDGLPSEFPELLTGSEPPALPGERVGTPGYELRAEIGRGLFGAVYRAYQPSVGREVAVKVINPELANSAAFIRRFAVEAQMISRVEHPNVVPLYDFWRGPEAALLVMRLMRGGNLAEWAADEGVDRDAALRLVDQIGGALATAHALGIAHGDVQAGNVLLNEAGDFFLGDFGIATDSPVAAGGSAPQNDVAAFAAMVQAVVPDDAFTDGEHALMAAARAGEYASADEWIETWRREVGAALSAPTYTPTRNPYKGLAAFGELDAQDFHGREAVTADLIAAVESNRLVAVVGPSGVGKSSVVRAGLLPALRRGAAHGSDRWLIANCVPGSHPYERLATSLILVAASIPNDLDDLLRADDRGLVKAVERYLPADSQLLLVIDQFEELFTLTRDQSTSERFLDLLQASVEDPLSPVRVLLTIRADFLDRPLRHPEFGNRLRAGTVLVSAPTDAEMRQIITQPAAGVGVEFESGLVERTVAEVQGEAGALPLVEFALTELFEARDSDLLTLESYESSGGVTAALGRRAEEIYAGLEAAERDVARQVFMRLVTPGDAGGDTRHRLRASELVRLGLDAESVDKVLGRFGDHRLLTFDLDEVTRSSTVEVAHEALLREWPRLKDWIDGHRQELVLRSRLAIAVGDWEDSDRAEPYLLRGSRLTQHEAWVDNADLPLSSAERDLLVRSRLAEDGRQATQRRRRRLVMGGFAAAAAIGFVLALAALDASRKASDNEQQAVAAAEDADAARTEADQHADEAQASSDEATASAALAEDARAVSEQQAQIAEGRALLAAVPSVIADDPQLALLLSIAGADRLGDVPTATAALYRSIGADRTVYETEWPAEAGEVSQLEAGFSPDGDISPDGRLLAVVGPFGNTVEVHDIDAGAMLWSHSFEVEPVSEYKLMAQFVGDGSELLLGLSWHPAAERASETPSSELGFHVFDSTEGVSLRSYDGGPCGPVGQYSSNRAYISETAAAAAVTMSVSQDWFEENGCSSVISVLASEVPEIDIHRLDTGTGGLTPIVTGWGQGHIHIGMSADGRRAALGGAISDPGFVNVIDIDSGALINKIGVGGPCDCADAEGVRVPLETFEHVSLSPDGSTLFRTDVSGGTSGSLPPLPQLFDVESGALLERVPRGQGRKSGAWFTADGSEFFVSDEAGRFTLFDVASADTRLSIPLDPGLGLVRATPDVTRIATFPSDTDDSGRIVRVLSLESGSARAEIVDFDPCGDAPLDRSLYVDEGLISHRDLVSVYAYCNAVAGELGGTVGVETPDGPFDPAFVYTYSRASGMLLRIHRTFGGTFAVAGNDMAAMQTWTPLGDGSVVAGEVAIVDIRTGELVESLGGVCNLELAGYLLEPLACGGGGGLAIVNSDLAISPDGNIVAMGSWTMPGLGLAWNRSTGASIVLERPVSAVAISPDGTRLVFAEPNDLTSTIGALHLFSTDDFTRLEKFPGGLAGFAPGSLEFTPDGQMIVGITTGPVRGVDRYENLEAGQSTPQIRFVDAATLGTVKNHPDPHPGFRTTDFDLSADGTRLATVGEDGFARIWDIETLESITMLREIDVGGPAVAVAFIEELSQLAVSTRDDGVVLYHLDFDDILDEARSLLRRGVTSDECRDYFPGGDCPTLEEIRSR